jgi:hypothetical protein
VTVNVRNTVKGLLAPLRDNVFTVPTGPRTIKLLTVNVSAGAAPSIVTVLEVALEMMNAPEVLSGLPPTNSRHPATNHTPRWSNDWLSAPGRKPRALPKKTKLRLRLKWGDKRFAS